MEFRDKVKIAAFNAYKQALSEAKSDVELAVFMFIQGVIFAKTGKGVQNMENKYKEIVENEDYNFEIEDCKYDYINDDEKEKI